MIDIPTWQLMQETWVAVLGWPLQVLAVLYVAGVIGLVLIIFALGLLRRMLNP